MKSRNTGDAVTAAVIFIVVLIVIGTAIHLYNKMADYDEQVQTAWTPVEGSLKERYDSVPRLLGAVGLYIGHDIPEGDSLIAALPKFVAAKTIAERTIAANAIEDCLQRYYQDVAARYPGISSNPQVTTIVGIVRGSGEKLKEIAAPYNAVAERYNAYIRRFPGNVIAAVLGFAGSYAYIQPQLY